MELPLFIDLRTADRLSPLDKKLRLTKKERKQAEAVLLEFGGTVHRAERKLPANRNRPKSSYFPTSLRATRRKKKAVYDSESEDEVEMEESVEESNSEEEIDHPRSSSIPPPPKRTRRVLEEVTNDERPTRTHPPAKKAPRQPLQRASEVSESYRPAYKTSRRRGPHN
ncbi:hypothetical protein DFH09DRAFT_1093603 [Mycena vulgaris]|nr:hypothetical protein DFH09DRAFT_1093603 [Mycena vulgaris]